MCRPHREHGACTRQDISTVHSCLDSLVSWTKAHARLAASLAEVSQLESRNDQSLTGQDVVKEGVSYHSQGSDECSQQFQEPD